MKKYIFSLIIFILGFGVSFGTSWDQSPEGIINDLKHEEVQNTALDRIHGQGQGAKETLTQIKDNSRGYIQWMGYIGLSIAFILIMYNGIMILTNFGDENKFSKSKKRFVSLIVGVILLTSAYFLIKVVVGLVGGIF